MRNNTSSWVSVVTEVLHLRVQVAHAPVLPSMTQRQRLPQERCAHGRRQDLLSSRGGVVGGGGGGVKTTFTDRSGVRKLSLC
jgi:hypothetical protein